MTRAEQYARWVLEPVNEKKTGRYIKLAAKRFLSDLKRHDLYFDEVEAGKIINFGEGYCNQWEGDWEGVPVKFEPWQCFVFQQIYGWIRKDTGLRRFEEVYVQIAKKNGKSTMSAVLMNFHLFADDRIKTPKIFTAANNEDQAKICVNMAGRIIEASPELNEYIRDGEVALMNYKENITEVVHYGKNGFIKAMSKESGDKNSKTAGGKHGINSSLGVIDEFGMSPDHGASKPIKTSMASRKERLMFYITTAGFNMNGPCYSELRKVGIELLEGLIVKDNYLPIIFEMDKPAGEDGKPIKITAKWLLDNEWIWEQSNPNMGVSVHKEFLKSMLEDAITYGGTTEVDTMTLNFDEWMESAEAWVSADVWNTNTHGQKEESLAAGRCFGGIEIVNGLEISCFCLYFPDFFGQIAAVKPLFWCPSDAIGNKNIGLNLRELSEDGLIELEEGNTVSNEFIYDIILAEIEKYNMDSLAFPSTLKNHDVIQNLIKKGIKCNPIRKSYQELDTPTKEWEKILNAGQIEHFVNPVLAWQNLNTMVVKSRDGEIRVEKAGGRTSGITASIYALTQWKIISAEDSGDWKIESW